MVAWLLAAALAQEPCTAPTSPPPAELSVAWVSPLRQRVAPGGWIDVVETAALRRWLSAENAGLGRTLQHLGLRRQAKPPPGRWKVTIFEVRAASLCRPVEGAEAGEVVGGLPACARPAVRGETDGCGHLVDRADERPSLPVYRVRWADVAQGGFCVLPAERFVAEGSRR